MGFPVAVLKAIILYCVSLAAGAAACFPAVGDLPCNPYCADACLMLSPHRQADITSREVTPTGEFAVYHEWQGRATGNDKLFAGAQK